MRTETNKASEEDEEEMNGRIKEEIRNKRNRKTAKVEQEKSNIFTKMAWATHP